MSQSAPWSEAERRRLRRLAATYTAAQIADQLGRTVNAVRQQAYLHGIALQKAGDADYRTKYPDALVERARVLHEAGEKPRAIAELIGVPVGSVKSFVYYQGRLEASRSLVAA
jgi:hypothetical protein